MEMFQSPFHRPGSFAGIVIFRVRLISRLLWSEDECGNLSILIAMAHWLSVACETLAETESLGVCNDKLVSEHVKILVSRKDLVETAGIRSDCWRTWNDAYVILDQHPISD